MSELALELLEAQRDNVNRKVLAAKEEIEDEFYWVEEHNK